MIPPPAYPPSWNGAPNITTVPIWTPGPVQVARSGTYPAIESLRWLAERRLSYWFDIDTHGFVILDRLRRHVPHTRSLLMDLATLLAHESQWVREPKPTVARLDNLHPDEADLYHDLVENNLGASVRLEQERIAYAAIERAVRSPGGRPTNPA
jgi:hypothetical protein